MRKVAAASRLPAFPATVYKVLNKRKLVCTRFLFACFVMTRLLCKATQLGLAMGAEALLPQLKQKQAPVVRDKESRQGMLEWFITKENARLVYNQRECQHGKNARLNANWKGLGSLIRCMQNWKSDLNYKSHQSEADRLAAFLSIIYSVGYMIKSVYK